MIAGKYRYNCVRIYLSNAQQSVKNGRSGAFVTWLNEPRGWPASQERKVVPLVSLHHGKQNLVPRNAPLGATLRLFQEGSIAEDGAILFRAVAPHSPGQFA